MKWTVLRESRNDQNWFKKKREKEPTNNHKISWNKKLRVHKLYQTFKQQIMPILNCFSVQKEMGAIEFISRRVYFAIKTKESTSKKEISRSVLENNFIKFNIYD